MPPPRLGRNTELTLTGALPFTAAGLYIAADFQAFPLAVVGMPTCSSYLGPSLISLQPVFTDIRGQARLPAPIPNLPGLMGQEFVAQWLVADGGVNSFGAVTSDAVRGFMGD